MTKSQLIELLSARHRPAGTEGCRARGEDDAGRHGAHACVGQPHRDPRLRQLRVELPPPRTGRNPEDRREGAGAAQVRPALQGGQGACASAWITTKAEYCSNSTRRRASARRFFFASRFNRRVMRARRGRVGGAHTRERTATSLTLRGARAHRITTAPAQLGLSSYIPRMRSGSPQTVLGDPPVMIRSLGPVQGVRSSNPSPPAHHRGCRGAATQHACRWLWQVSTTVDRAERTWKSTGFRLAKSGRAPLSLNNPFRLPRTPFFARRRRFQVARVPCHQGTGAIPVSSRPAQRIDRRVWPTLPL
jgi:hypothetical protein